MDYFEKLFDSLNYIENELFRENLIKNIHKKVFISKYHFHRIFHIGTKFTIGEYIRRRRFTEIEKKIVSKNQRIIDIAFDCNYNSHEALSRAFKSYFGISPSSYSLNPIRNPLLLQEALKPDELMYSYYDLSIEPQIIQINDLKILGLSEKINFKDNNLETIWYNFKQIMKNNNLDNSNDSGYTIWLSEEKQSQLIHRDKKYQIAVGIEYKNQNIKSLNIYNIPSGLYACFSIHNNFNFIYQTYAYIYFSWLKKNKYILSDGIVFEEYSNSFSKEENKGMMKIYIPIEKQ